MFDAFDGKRAKTERKRFAAPLAIAVVVYAGIGGGVALFASSGSEKPPEDEPIDVVLEKKPKPSTPPPVSPVQKPPEVVVNKTPRPRSSLPPPPTLQAPKAMPTQAPPKDVAAKPTGPVTEDCGANCGDGASDGGDNAITDTNTQPTPSPTPSPTVAAKPKKMEPVDLPENAKPPVPDPGNPQPQYPEAARAAGQEGLVILKLAISEKGKIRSIEVLKSDPAFDDAAIDAVKRWKFTPAMVDGSPIAVYRIVKIPFRLG